jgi:hypothetical protein
MTKTYDNIVGLRDRTPAEEEQYAKDQKEYQDNIVPKKLAYVKELRLQRLIETDYLANSDVTMPDNVKTWRQTLRDLPANHTDEAAYDALLARDSDGNLTHSVWSKP